MPALTFLEHSGESRTVNARVGDSVMRAARAGDVPGIVGECGGSMTCLTCHCYVRPEDADRIPPPGEEERLLLDCVMEGRMNSRLSCQIVVTPALEGATFDLPSWQG